MESRKSKFLKTWIAGNLIVYPAFLGCIHPLIAHGFTGDHDRLLTTAQFVMHTLSIFVFVFFLVFSRNKMFEIIGKKKTFSDIWPFMFFSPWVFWLGYYTLFVPFDILFMFLSIGVINAIQLRSLVANARKWIWQCILGYFLAAVAGILIGLGAYLNYYKDFSGISHDFATWVSISIPAAIVIAFYFKYIFSKQILNGDEIIDASKPEIKVSKAA